MFGSVILEVFIGLILVYILVGIFATAIREGLEGWLKMRASFLEHGIRELLHWRESGELADNFYKHPVIFGLFPNDFTPTTRTSLPGFFSSLRSKKTNLPSYIPASSFATALMDLAARGPVTDSLSGTTPALTAEKIRANVWKLKNPPVQRVLLAALDSAQDDLPKARVMIEEWYNSGMERVSGWYKRSTQKVIFWIALVVAVALNINTVIIADFLYRDGAVRSAVVKRAEAVAAASVEKGATDPTALKGTLEEINNLQLPMGWESKEATDRIVKLGQPRNDVSLMQNVADGGLLAAGWLMTALAGMLGAPFWFDMLNKVMVIRSTVKPREKSREEGSKDSESKAPPQSAQAANAPPPFPPVQHDQPDDESRGFDAMDVAVERETLDEELPITRGGVA